MGDVTRNFVSQWTHQEPRDLSVKGGDAEAQWRSVQRVSARCQPTLRDDDVESVYANDVAPQWLGWACAADRSASRRADTTTAAATAAPVDNAELEHREQVSDSSLPVKIRARPQSASTSRTRVSRDAAANLDLEFGFGAAAPAKSRSRPQSAKLPRSHLGSAAVGDHPPSPSVLLSSVIPQQMKDSKWTEMMFRSPEFQQTNLIRLEHETYELLQSVFRKERRAAQASNSTGLVKQKSKKDQRNKQNAVAMKSTKASEAKQKLQKKTEEYSSTLKSVPCGSGMQLARDRKQNGPNGFTQSKQKRPLRTNVQQRDGHFIPSLNQPDSGDAGHTPFTPRQLARKTTRGKESTAKKSLRSEARQREGVVESSTQSRDEDDAVRKRVLVEMDWAPGEKETDHADEVKAKKQTRGRLKRGTHAKQQPNNNCAVGYPEQALLASASEQPSLNTKPPLQHPLCAHHERSKAPQIVTEEAVQQRATDAVESPNAGTEAELESLWISLPGECSDHRSLPLPDGNCVDEGSRCAASAPAPECKMADDEGEDRDVERSFLLNEDELDRQQLQSFLDASPAANQFIRQDFALHQDHGSTGGADNVGLSLATPRHLEHGALLHPDAASDSPVRTVADASLQPPLEELLPVAAASPPSRLPETAFEHNLSFSSVGGCGMEIDAQGSEIAGRGESDGWSCPSLMETAEATRGFDPGLLDTELNLCESMASPSREDSPTHIQSPSTDHGIEAIETGALELQHSGDAKDAEELRLTKETAFWVVDESHNDGEELGTGNDEPLEAIESFGSSTDPNAMDLLLREVATAVGTSRNDSMRSATEPLEDERGPEDPDKGASDSTTGEASSDQESASNNLTEVENGVNWGFCASNSVEARHRGERDPETDPFPDPASAETGSGESNNEVAIAQSSAACDAATVVGDIAPRVGCETAPTSRFRQSEDVDVQFNCLYHNPVFRSIEREDKAPTTSGAAERVSDCGGEEAVVSAVIFFENREEALDLPSECFEHVGLHSFDADNSKTANQAELQNPVASQEHAIGTECQGACELEQEQDDSAPRSVDVVVAGSVSGSAALDPPCDPDSLMQTPQSPLRSTDALDGNLGVQAIITPNSRNKDIPEEEEEEEEGPPHADSPPDAFPAGEAESVVTQASETRLPAECEDEASPTSVTCSDKDAAAVASVFVDEERVKQDADVRDGERLLHHRSPTVAIPPPAGGVSKSGSGTSEPPEGSCLSGNDESMHLVVYDGATISECVSSFDEKKTEDAVDQPPYAEVTLLRAGDLLPCKEPETVNSSWGEASAATISIDTGHRGVEVAAGSEAQEPPDHVAAARRIQRQYRCFVQRQILADQLKFLVNQHHRQARKKTRRASTELKISLTSASSSNSRAAPSLSADSSFAALEIEKPLAQVLDVASALAAVVEAPERQVESEDLRAQDADDQARSEVSPEGNLRKEEPTELQHWLMDDEVVIEAELRGIEGPSSAAAAVFDDGLGVTVYEMSSEVLTSESHSENVDSSWTNAASLRDEGREAQEEEEEPLNPELSTASNAAEEGELGDTHEPPPVVRSSAAALISLPEDNGRAAVMAETGIFRSEPASDALIAQPPLVVSQPEDHRSSADNDAYLRARAASIALAALAFDDDEETMEPETQSSQDLSPELMMSSFHLVTATTWEEGEPLNEYAEEQLLSEPSGADHWERYLDAATNKSYYYNPRTQVSQWTLPEHCEVVDKVAALGDSVAMDDLNSPSSVVESGDPIQQQEAWHQVRKQSLLLETFGGWRKYLMNESAAIFFYHHERNEYFHSTDGSTPTEFSEAQQQLLYEQRPSPAVLSLEGEAVDANSSEWTDEDTAGHVSTSASDERWSLRRSVSQSAEKRDAWQVFVDAERGLPFYYNAHTGESTWETPAVFMGEPNASSPSASEWAVYVDDASGAEYYVNVVTGETSWDRPADFDKTTTEHEAAIHETHGDGEAGRVVGHQQGHHERVEDCEEDGGAEYVIRIDEGHSAELLF